MSAKEYLMIDRVPEGTVNLPPSKSISHRALICGALAGGGILRNTEPKNDDIMATLNCLREIGLKSSTRDNSTVISEGIMPYIEGSGLQEKNRRLVLDCGESGSTLRFLIPPALLTGAEVTITGGERLLQRPLLNFLDALRVNGGQFQLNQRQLHMQGPITPGLYELPGNISSQFVSGLLMTLPLLNGESEIRLTTKLESRPYVDMTLDVMSRFGVNVERKDERMFSIRGGQRYTPVDYFVEGDYSAGAYFLVAGALGCDVKCAGLAENSIQGDSKIIEFIRSCGGEITKDGEGFLKASADRLVGITADISQCPDLAPPLAVLLCLSKGKSKVTGAERLRMKESDRLKTITETLNTLGAKITEGADCLSIEGVDEMEGGTIDPHNDHRIAMAGALASIKCKKPVKVLDPGCVNKSYPNFFRDFCRVVRKGRGERK